MLPLYLRERDPSPIVQEVGWAPGLVWTGAENLATTGIRFRGRPVRGALLYRINYPASQQQQRQKSTPPPTHPVPSRPARSFVTIE